MTNTDKAFDEILADYFTWKGEAIHLVNQTANYKRMKTALTQLLNSEVEKAVKKVNRFEVIDETGRAYVKGSIYGSPVKVELSYQDDGRTLKVFVAQLNQGEGDGR